MEDTGEDARTEHPLMRITTLGEFALDRLVPSPSLTPDEPPNYARVPRSEWGNRGPAMALLTMHSGGETIFKLSGQRRLWVDADALLSLASQAMRAECQGQDPLPLFEEAHALARGAFLEEDLYATWAQGHRHTIDGARHRVLFKLVDLSLKGERVGRGEELLLEALEEDPADEDALCRLMILLVEQGRRREALQLYQYTEDVLQEELTEPAVYTRELAHRIRMGLVLRDRRDRYLTHEEYELTKVALAREEVPAEALALLSAWIEGERLLVDEQEGVGGIGFCRMDSKAVAPLPHILASFFARRPYKRKAGHYPGWNGFYLLLYRDVEEGWKLERIRKDSPDAQFVPVNAARIKAVEEIKKRLGNDLGDHEE